MAGSFTSASAQYLSVNSGLGFGAGMVPMTMACWYRHASNGQRELLHLGAASSDDHRNTLRVSTSTLQAQSRTTSVASATMAGVAVGWNHCAGVWSSATSRTAYLGGVAGTPNTTSRVPNAPTDFLLGANFPLTTYLDGDIAEVGVWSAVLDADEIAALAKGFSPAIVRPSALVFYAPLVRSLTQDLKGLTLTNNGAVAVADHCRVLMPRSTQLRKYTTATGAVAHTPRMSLLGVG